MKTKIPILALLLATTACAPQVDDPFPYEEIYRAQCQTRLTCAPDSEDTFPVEQCVDTYMDVLPDRECPELDAKVQECLAGLTCEDFNHFWNIEDGIAPDVCHDEITELSLCLQD